MITAEEAFYKNHLKQYGDSIEYFVDPAPNQWKFLIPEL